MKLAAIALALLVCTSANAVERISIGHDQFIPRTAELHHDASLVIPAGETIVLSDSIDVHTIEVSGTLKIDRLSSVFINCVNLVVMEGGTLDCGTEQDPILGAVVIQIKNVPLDTENDPYQWGNGIICFGNWYSCGFPVPAWSAGSLPTELAGVDAFKASIQADTFRNVIVQSENPFGTRGHTVVTGNGYCDVRNTSFIGLGRTMNANLSNTVASGGGFTVGTNQIAKYAFHWHHNHPDNPLNHGVLKNCHFDGNGVNKWGVVIHGTHFVEVSDCIVENFNGGGIVTEDGNETNNTIHHNLVRGITGNGVNDKFNQVAPRNNPGAAGTGIWLHGTKNVVIDNLVVDCAIGVQLFYRNISASTLASLAPESPGAVPNIKVDYRQAIPIVMSGNTSVDCRAGLEQWNSPPLLAVSSFTALRSANAAVLMGDGEPGSLSLSDSVLLGGNHGVSSSAAYTTLVKLDRCRIEGFQKGVKESATYLITDCSLANAVDVLLDLRPKKMRIVDCMLNGTVKLQFSQRAAWYGSYMPFVTATNWNGTGDNLVFVEPTQYAALPAKVSSTADRMAAIEPMTIGELFARYGYAANGFTCDESQTLAIDGVVGAKAFQGEHAYGPHRMAATYGLNQTTPMQANTTSVAFNFRYSGPPVGEPEQWSGALPSDGAVGFVNKPGLGNVVLVDGKKHKNWSNRVLQASGHPYAILKSEIPEAFTAGTHRVETYMTQDGAEIEGSRIAYFYHIGEASPPPPPPPPPPTTEERVTALELQIKQLQALIAQLQALIAKLTGN